MEKESWNDIYLKLNIRKAQGKTDDFGNYIFEVEASNENLDLQNQIVLQNALLESKDEFLRSGVISYDHLHKRRDADGNVISDPSMVIGEPIDVKTDGKSTIVVGKLYAHNDKAAALIKMLKDGSTRIKASVGGIFPEIVRNLKTGVEKITHVLWNDLALTISPVNNTVGAAVFAKAMNPEEFVKALTAGYGTDSSEMAGGRTLIKEDLGDEEDKNAIDVTEEDVDKAVEELLEESPEKLACRSLGVALSLGQVKGEDAACRFLEKKGIEKGKAREIVREFIEQGGEVMKKSFSKTVSDLLKSLTGKDEADDLKKDEDVKAEDLFVEASSDDEKDDSDEEEEKEEVKETKKSNGDSKAEAKEDDAEDEEEDEEESEDEDEADDDLVDGAEFLKSLQSTCADLEKVSKSQSERIDDIGKAVENLAQMVYAIGGEKLPSRTTVAKSLNGNEKTLNKSTSKERPTQDDFDKVQAVLIKSVREGKIDAMQSSLISSDFQKCMATGKPMNSEYYNFLLKEINKEV